MAWVEQLPSGKYRGLYRTPEGAKRSAGTFEHKKPALSAATIKEAESTRPNWRDPMAAQITWAKWCERWWETRSVDSSTLRRDESRRDARLMPKWGDVPLAEITRHEVKAWAAELREDSLSPATVQRCVALLSASLRGAVDAEILETNPASRLRLPNPSNAKERYASRDEAGMLLEEFEEGSVERAVVAFLFGLGPRWGEAAGARIERLSFDAGVRQYRVAEVWDDANNVLKEYPKGKRRRSVPMPDWVWDEVAPLIGNRKTGFIFRTADGSPLDYHNFRNRVWSRAVVGAGLAPFNIHACRHSYASWLIQDGVSLAKVGQLLGHVSPATTQRYAHLLNPDAEQILSSLRNPMRNGSNKKGSERGANVGQEGAHIHANVLPFTRIRKVAGT
jgi:integrase